MRDVNHNISIPCQPAEIMDTASGTAKSDCDYHSSCLRGALCLGVSESAGHVRRGTSIEQPLRCTMSERHRALRNPKKCQGHPAWAIEAAATALRPPLQTPIGNDDHDVTVTQISGRG